MSWTVAWSPVCHVDILHMHYKAAEGVCMAVVAFATHGAGQVELDDPDSASPDGRIRARGGYALVRFVEREARIDVLRIRSSTPPARRGTSLLGAAPPPPDDRP